MNGQDETMLNYCALLISIVQDKPIQKALMDMKIVKASKKRKQAAGKTKRDTSERDAEIARRYLGGGSAADIAADLHVGIATVYRTLAAAGVPMRGRREKSANV